MGGGGGFISVITDPISDVLGTSGGGGGLLGAVEDVGKNIGDAGEIIDKNVLQPALQDPVGTAVKIGAIALAPATGGTSLYAIPAYTATKAIAAGVPLEDVAKMTAISAAATAAGVSVADYVGTLAEFGTDVGSQQTAMLAQQNVGIGTGGAVSTAVGQVAGGAVAGTVNAAATGRDPVTGLLTGAVNAGVGAGVGAAVDTGAGLMTSTNLNDFMTGNGNFNPFTGKMTGSTGMDETLGTYDPYAGLNAGLNAGDAEAQQGGFYGTPDGSTPPNPYENLSDADLSAVIAAKDAQAGNSTFSNLLKTYGPQVVKALLGTRGGTGAGAGGAGAGGNTGLGNLLGGGVNAYLSTQQRQAIQNAYNQQSQAVRNAATQAQNIASFTPVGTTNFFGSSQFQVDPTTGKLVSAGFTPTAQVAGQMQNLFGLGAQALPTTANTQDIQRQYIAQQQGLLAPSREQQLAQLKNQQFQTGRTGLATGGTVAGYGAGQPGLMQTNPEMAAYYNAIAQQNAQLAANAPTYAQNLLNAQINTGTGLFSSANTLQGYAQQPLTLSTDLAKAQAAAGASAGQLGLTGQTNAAQLGATGSLLGNAAMQGTYNQLGQTATGLGNQIGGMLLQNPTIANWLS